MTEWDDTIWTMMVEKAVVHRGRQITFVFQNGTKIKIGAQLLRLFSFAGNNLIMQTPSEICTTLQTFR